MTHKNRKIASKLSAASFLLVTANMQWSDVVAQDRKTDSIDASVVHLSIEAKAVGDPEPRQFTGTAVVVTQDGHVLTSAHNIPDKFDPDVFESSQILGSIGSGHAFPIQLSPTGIFNAEQDIAILKFPPLPVDSGFKPALIEDKRMEMGVPISIRGFPLGKNIMETRGIISGEVAGGAYVTDAVANNGSSGSPVFNGGYLVGILKGGYRNQKGELFGLNQVIPIARAVNEAVALDWAKPEGDKRQCAGRRIEITGDGSFPLAEASRSFELNDPNQIENALITDYPSIVVNGGNLKITGLNDLVTLRLCRLELKNAGRLVIGSSSVRMLVGDLAALMHEGLADVA